MIFFLLLQNMSDNFHYNKNLKPFAREHRNHSTRAEIRLWCELLKNKKMLGFSFLRQRPIANYIADFFCKELKLIIETDGITHEWVCAFEKDNLRTDELQKLGYIVLRFNDDEVMRDIENVRRTIEGLIYKKFPEKVKI